MKKTILLLISFSLTIYVYSTESQNFKNRIAKTMELWQTVEDTTFVILGVADLPQPAKNTVGNYEYNGWFVEQRVYHITDNVNKTEYYKITMKNTDTNEKKILKLSKDGKELR